MYFLESDSLGYELFEGESYILLLTSASPVPALSILFE